MLTFWQTPVQNCCFCFLYTMVFLQELGTVQYPKPNQTKPCSSQHIISLNLSRGVSENIFGVTGVTSHTGQSAHVAYLEPRLLQVLWSVMAACHQKHCEIITYLVLSYNLLVVPIFWWFSSSPVQSSCWSWPTVNVVWSRKILACGIFSAQRL